MVFEAEIGLNKHKLMWSKSIASLSNIAEAITFTINKDSISLSATNTSKTSYAQIYFKKTFSTNFPLILIIYYQKDMMMGNNRRRNRVILFLLIHDIWQLYLKV